MTLTERLRALFAPKEQRDAADARFQLLRDYVETFSSPHGTRVLEDILKRNFTGYSIAATAPQGGIDPYRSFIHEGRRLAALDIAGCADPNALNQEYERLKEQRDAGNHDEHY